MNKDILTKPIDGGFGARQALKESHKDRVKKLENQLIESNMMKNALKIEREKAFEPNDILDFDDSSMYMSPMPRVIYSFNNKDCNIMEDTVLISESYSRAITSYSKYLYKYIIEKNTINRKKYAKRMKMLESKFPNLKDASKPLEWYMRLSIIRDDIILTKPGITLEHYMKSFGARKKMLLTRR